MNTTGIVQFAQGTLASPTAFTADNSGLSTAHNNGEVSKWTNTGAPTGKQIVARNWKVQKTGTVGSVTLAVNTQNTSSDIPTISSVNGKLYLVLDDEASTTANFTDETGGTVIEMYDNGTNGDITAGDKVYTVSGVNLTNGMYFTVAQDISPAPGGVSNGLKAWYNAGNGVYTDTAATTVPTEAQPVNRWLDLSGNNKTLIPGTTPDYRTATSSQAMNFNPVVDFQ